jgi:nitric oxide reductase activation protein
VSSFSQLSSEEQDKRPSSSKKTSQNSDSPPTSSKSFEKSLNEDERVKIEKSSDDLSSVNKRVD